MGFARPDPRIAEGTMDLVLGGIASNEQITKRITSTIYKGRQVGMHGSYSRNTHMCIYREAGTASYR